MFMDKAQRKVLFVSFGLTIVYSLQRPKPFIQDLLDQIYNKIIPLTQELAVTVFFWELRLN
jgi:hypothetical protein